MSCQENRELLKSYREDSKSDTGETKGIPQPPLFKGGTGEVTVLPKEFGDCIKKIDFTEMLTSRRSRREYTSEALTLEEFSFLLWAAQGVKKIPKSGKACFRTVPSAGARHALELYAAVLNIEGLQKGIYHYLAAEHKLDYLGTPDDMENQLAEALCGQKFAVSGASVLMLSAVPERMEWRYGELAAKYILLDAGHACQNVYLASEAFECGCCAMAAYMQERMDAFLGLDAEKENVVYAAAIGRTDLRS